MTAPAHRNIASTFSNVGRIAGVLVILDGVKVILGWLLGNVWLTGGYHTSTFVAPNTALLFVISGAAIILLTFQNRAAAILASCLGLFIAAVALLTVAEYLFHINFGIDTIFLRRALVNWTVTDTPGRFAIQTAFAFSAAGLALLLTDVSERKFSLAEPFSAFVFLIGSFGLLGYLYSAKALHGVMALETTTVLLCLGCGLLLIRPQQGTMSLVSSNGSAGIVVRRLLLATAVVIPVLGYIQVIVGTYGWMGRETRNALFAAGSVLAVWLFILSAARAIQSQETRRRVSEERFRSLSASSPVGIFLADPQGQLLYCNPRCAAICGFREHKELGDGWLRQVHDEDRERVERAWHAAVLQRADWHEEVRWKDAHGGGLRWTICRGAPMRSEEGSLLGYAGTVEDITDRRQAESALRKSDKLAAMGRLAGIIAHEINNPLEALTNLFYLLRKHPSLDEQARNFADLADEQLGRVSAITRQSLSFYRESAKVIPVSLSDVLNDVLAVYRESAVAQGISVERRFDTDGIVIAHPGELRQVFVNIVGNALQAMPKGGRLRVHLFPATDWNRAGRSGVRVNVVDTGEGIPSDVARRLFEPFFTTKAEKGTGLGLWVSRGIVEKHEGHIAFRSTRHPLTTCFTVFIPTVAQQLRRARTQVSEAATGTTGA
ncbi:MAG: two-component system sensor histidine kinase NtrB [Terriglobales bacterium]